MLGGGVVLALACAVATLLRSGGEQTVVACEVELRRGGEQRAEADEPLPIPVATDNRSTTRLTAAADPRAPGLPPPFTRGARRAVEALLAAQTTTNWSRVDEALAALLLRARAPHAAAPSLVIGVLGGSVTAGVGCAPPHTDGRQNASCAWGARLERVLCSSLSAAAAPSASAACPVRVVNLARRATTSFGAAPLYLPRRVARVPLFSFTPAPPPYSLTFLCNEKCPNLRIIR